MKQPTIDGQRCRQAPDRILIIARHSGEGTAGGVELEQWGAVRYTVRRGKAARVDGFLGPERGRVVAALSAHKATNH